MTRRRSRGRPGSASSPTARGRPRAGEPPPHSLEIRSIRERLRADDDLVRDGDRPDGRARPGTSASPTRAERERPHVRDSRAARTCGCCSCARRGGGPGWRRACTGSALEEAARQGYETIRLYTPYGAARARAFYEREGWEQAGPGVPRAAARARPGRVPSRARCDPGARMFEDAAERSRVSMRTRWDRVRAGWRTMVQAASRSRSPGRSRSGCWGHEAPFFAPGRGDDRARARATTSAAGGRSSSSVAVTLGVAVADLLALPARHRRRPARAGGVRSRSGSACSSGPASCSSTRSRSRPCSCSRSRRRPAGSRSRARSTR